MNGEEMNFTDILAAAELIGKTYTECGLTADPGISNVTVRGSFFGFPVTGGAWFFPAGEDRSPRLKGVSFSVKSGLIPELYGKLMDRYGGPLDCGETPFAIANGGAVRWCLFDAGASEVTVSMGSLKDSVDVSISENPNPGYTGKLVLIRNQDGLPSPFEKRLVLAAEAYENGILTVSLTNRLGEPAVYTERFELAKSTDGKSYGHLVRKPNRPETAGTGVLEIGNKETRKLTFDLRLFGKVEPGKYMLIFNDRQLLFELVPEESGSGR